MIHEVLLALDGHVGGLLREGEDGFLLTGEVDFLTEAERHLIEQAVQVGFYCKRLSDFVAAVRRRHFGAGLRVAPPDDGLRTRALASPVPVAGMGHYSYGMALRIESALREYRGRVVDLEAQILREPSLPLGHLTSALEDDRRVLYVLHRLIERVRAAKINGAQLLDLLWTTAASHMGSGSVYKCLWSTVEGAGQVLANQLVAWLVYGRLIDPDGEFFIGRLNGHQPSWLPGSALYGGPVDDFSIGIDAAAAQREWQGLFFLKPKAVPHALVSLEAARNALFVGKAVRVLLRSGRWLSQASSGECTLEPPDVQDVVDALRTCFDTKSPTYVVERGIERIRVGAATRLRQLVVIEAELAQHLAALKGFYLLGYGAFYQTFLEASRPLLQRAPSAHAESDLVHGPWSTAMSEREVASESTLPSACSGSPRTSASPLAATSRRPPPERTLASRFKVRFVPSRFEFDTFEDAARQVKLVGMAHLTSGHAELGLGLGDGPSSAGSRGGGAVAAAAQSAMLWLTARQRVAHGFDHAFTFQVHAPPSIAPGSTGAAPHATAVAAEHGCRIALCLQHQLSPSVLQARGRSAAAAATTAGAATTPEAPLGMDVSAGSIGGSDESPPRCLVWPDLGECLALEITYRALAPRGLATPLAKISLALYASHPGLWDGRRPSSTAAGGSGAAGATACPLVEQLVSTSFSVAAPRAMVHLVRLRYDARSRQMLVFFGADAVAPACTAEVDLAMSLSLDLGCTYIGFCLLPLEHQHQLIGGSVASARELRASQVQYSVRDRPVSITSWRHRAHSAVVSLPLVGPDGDANAAANEEPMGIDMWFAAMDISYQVPWPLPLVITQDCLEQYNRLFRLLLAFRYAHLELQRVDLPRDEIMAWALRAQLSHFVSQVLLFFQQDVVEVEHQRLLQSIESSLDFDEVVAAHEEFLSNVATHCFLKAPDLHLALKAALRVAIVFCRLKLAPPGAPNIADAPSGSWALAVATRAAAAAIAERNAELRRLRGQFELRVRSVLQMMTSMHKQGMHAHLSQLLLRLDYNGYFSGEVGDD